MASDGLMYCRGLNLRREMVISNILKESKYEHGSNVSNWY